MFDNWYVVQVRTGKEEEIVKKCQFYIDHGILLDCFIPITKKKKIPDLTKLLGNDGEDIYPIYPQEAMFLTKFSNRNHVVDMSCGVIENDKIIITDGPLMNLEGYITKIDRHKRIAYVDVELLGKITRVQVGLEIISKT